MSATAQAAYPAMVWQRFRAPGHAAPPPAGAAIGRGGERKQGGELELWLEVAAGKVRRAGFRAFGCPYLVASADAACEAIAGQSVASLVEFDAGALIQGLRVPPERFPIKIWIEDAVRAAAQSSHGGV
jgi:NifU-like protein involved in Fe-S cluster formation